MKNYLLFLLIPFVFAANSCAQDDPFLDEIENPSILRSSEIVVGDSHLAFTSITGNADRSRIVLTYRSGSEHASFDGRILQVTSNNRGRSWSSPIEIYSADGKDARDPQLFAVSDSELLCRFFERESEAVSHVKVLRSKNFGRTYEGTSTLPFPTASETFAAARGNMVMVDDIIYTISSPRTTTDGRGATSPGWMRPSAPNKARTRASTRLRSATPTGCSTASPGRTSKMATCSSAKARIWARRGLGSICRYADTRRRSLRTMEVSS